VEAARSGPHPDNKVFRYAIAYISSGRFEEVNL
jgi:hypothetical protein